LTLQKATSTPNRINQTSKPTEDKSPREKPATGNKKKPERKVVKTDGSPKMATMIAEETNSLKERFMKALKIDNQERAPRPVDDNLEKRYQDYSDPDIIKNI